jgi:hypothetical protein
MGGWIRHILVAGIIGAGLAGPAAAADCTRADFEGVVDAAAGTLRDMNAANKPKFQDKLKQLRDKRGWTQDQFVKEATPLVVDERIAGFDQQSAALLERIAAGGEAGAASFTPDCAMLESLKGAMKVLVETQTAKWHYMMGRVDAELAK